jgi:hypothetical protein
MKRSVGVGAVALFIVATLPGIVAAQDSIYGGQEKQFAGQWSLWPNEFVTTTIRPTGQPLIPLFEGWYDNPDGTYGLSFGYLNLNSEESFYIPIGPDNFIEPAEFNGMQPTFFMPAIPRGREGEQRHYRHESVFSVNVPKDWGNKDLVWTLRYNGKTVKVPGRITVEMYAVENIHAGTSAPDAAEMRFDPSAPAGRGRSGPETGPLRAKVGTPLPLSVWVKPVTQARHTVYWFSHQGPAAVQFQPQQSPIEAVGGEVKTMATFSEPGDYMLRVTAVQTLASMVQFCCYTNGYVKVTVTP